MKNEHMVDMNRYPIRRAPFSVKQSVPAIDPHPWDIKPDDPELMRQVRMTAVSAALTSATIVLFLLAVFMLVPKPARADDAPPKIKIEVTRAELVLIGQGVMKLPYETAAPVLNNLQAQLNAIDKAAAEAAKAPPADK